MSNIERAIEIWVKALNDILAILLKSPQAWNQDVYGLMRQINEGLAITAATLTAIFFLYGLSRQSAKLQDFKHPEIWFGHFLRFALSTGIVTVSMSFMEYLFGVVQGILRTISYNSNLSTFNMTVPEEISTALDNAGLIELSTSGFDFTGIKVAILGLLAMILIFACSIILLVIAWGRFITLYLHFALSGIFLSALASEQTQNIAISFIKSFLNASLRAVIILVALIIYSKLISSDHSDAIAAIVDGDTAGGLLLYMKEFLIGALVTLSICKSGDAIVQKWGL